MYKYCTAMIALIVILAFSQSQRQYSSPTSAAGSVARVHAKQPSIKRAAYDGCYRVDEGQAQHLFVCQLSVTGVYVDNEKVMSMEIISASPMLLKLMIRILMCPESLNTILNVPLRHRLVASADSRRVEE